MNWNSLFKCCSRSVVEGKERAECAVCGREASVTHMLTHSCECYMHKSCFLGLVGESARNFSARVDCRNCQSVLLETADEVTATLYAAILNGDFDCLKNTFRGVGKRFTGPGDALENPPFFKEPWFSLISIISRRMNMSRDEYIFDRNRDPFSKRSSVKAS